ncbi:MAG: DUF928 domain-containing protein [Elainella sp. C42_A2020_010]|nr:DUF928 domain-containing protein [Elainella sp. C42_A2020_010]
MIQFSVLSFLLASIPVATPLSAQPTIQRPRIPTVAQAAPEFSDVGRPRRRRGGGSRGSCLIADKPPLTALVPDSSTGYTLAQSPGLWFYLPYRLTDQHAIEFVLKDSQDNLVYTKTIAGNETAPGIVNLRLPESVILDTAQSYEWYLLVQCDAENQERFVFVNGAIRRLERPELQQQLASLPATEHSNLYVSENLWYDAIDSTATQLQNAPQNGTARSSWMELLQSVGLGELATEPLVPCCGLESDLNKSNLADPKHAESLPPAPAAH